jgi:hypothetical protein
MTSSSRILLIAATLTLSACDKNSNSNRTDGVKDAFDTRPNEKIRDAGEEVSEGVQDAAKDLKDRVKDN